MSLFEFVSNARFLVDTDGNKTAVLLDYAAWEELLTLLEHIEDTEEISRSHASGEEQVPWEQAKAELYTDDRPQRPFGLCAGEFDVPDDFDSPLPEEVLKEFKGTK